MCVQLASYLLQITGGGKVCSERLGALCVEVKTLCGLRPSFVSVSVASGNWTVEVLPVGLVAGVPWIGEWHGEVRGEIFGGIPSKKKFFQLKKGRNHIHKFNVCSKNYF